MTKIRLAKPSDARQVLEIYERSGAATPHPDDEDGHPAIDEACIKRRIRSTPFFYVASAHGEIEAYLAAYPFGGIFEGTIRKDPLTHALEQRHPCALYLERLAMRPDLRRDGAARKLIRQLHDDAASYDARAIICAVYAGNGSRQADLMQRLGYDPVDEVSIGEQRFSVYRRNLVTRRAP